MAEFVRITDVSPRDGLQNEPGIIPTSEKVRLVELLCRTGVDEVEVTSFVSAKWVPQLGDGERVFAQLQEPGPSARGLPHPVFSALVPNERGMQAALDCNRAAHKNLIEKVSVFTAASETFCRKNTNATIAESLDRFRPVVAAAHGSGLKVRGYISCVIACPFEGPIAPEAVARVAKQLMDLGVDEVDYGDTIGAGTAENTAAMLREVSREVPIEKGRAATTLHLHDTFGRASECVRAALDLGVRSFDGSVAGLGGCPYASSTLPDGTVRRAPGNISTDLLVRTIHEAGYRTNLNLDSLAQAASFAREIVAKSRAGGGG
ncbi:MAG: hydroxymethylglutaryl-CoA lyase [Phycisphaerales bacterium]|nr:hydroxymethylglutaryl-CoA lyase [Planctomycetota bacterium]